MRPPSLRFALGGGTLAVALAFALPLAARTLSPLGASAGPETVVAPPSTAPGLSSYDVTGTDGANVAFFSILSGYTWVGQRVSPAGTLLDPTEVTLPYPMQTFPQVAPSANGYLFVWQSSTGLQYAHLDSSLAGVEAAPVPLATIPSLGSFVLGHQPGGGYLVVWTPAQAGSIEGLLLDATGAPSGSPFPIATVDGNGTDLVIVYGGGNYQIVWEDDLDLLAAHVSAAGVLLDATPRTISTAVDGTIQLVAGATVDIVTWPGLHPDDAGLPVIYASRIGFDGTVLDPGGVVLAQSPVATLAYGSSVGVVLGWEASPPEDVPTLNLVSESDLSLRPPRCSAAKHHP